MINPMQTYRNMRARKISEARISELKAHDAMLEDALNDYPDVDLLKIRLRGALMQINTPHENRSSSHEFGRLAHEQMRTH